MTWNVLGEPKGRARTLVYRECPPGKTVYEVIERLENGQRVYTQQEATDILKDSGEHLDHLQGMREWRLHAFWTRFYEAVEKTCAPV